jgi:Retrotransposon gag protein
LLDTFKGSDNQNDDESFIHIFLERLSLLRVSDDVICRIFSTCLVGEAWKWYKRLSSSSIKSFYDFFDVFLERYSHIKVLWVTVESLLYIKQGLTEKIRGYINRFMKSMRKIEKYFDEFTLIAIQWGLRNRGSDTIKHDSYRKNYRTFNKYISFIKGYMAREDNTNPDQRSLRSRSLRVKRSYILSRRDNRKGDSHNDGHRYNRKKGRYNDNLEYISYFTSYAQPMQDLSRLIWSKFELPRHIDIRMFEIRDENNYC